MAYRERDIYIYLIVASLTAHINSLCAVTSKNNIIWSRLHLTNLLKVFTAAEFAEELACFLFVVITSGLQETFLKPIFVQCQCRSRFMLLIHCHQ